MTDWSSGYVTEVGYTHGFYKELNPQLLGLAALARGLEAPGLGTAPIRLLELGCGQGVSANIIAAANPHIEYTAVDFNPAHIAGALKLAQAAGTPNLHLKEMSFADLAASDCGDVYDVITLHGIYTWVSEENRSNIRRIILNRLRPGGAVYLSYNTYPGWSPVVPLRRLFTDIAADQPNAPIFDRLDSAFAMFDRLKDVGARSISSNPGLSDRMEKARTLPRNYVAHEYLNGEWTIFHFGDIAHELSECKVGFASTTNFIDLIDEVNLSDAQRALLTQTKDIVRRESLRDLIVNQAFRRDLFLKGSIPMGGLAASQAWARIRIALTCRRCDVELKVKGTLGEAQLQSDVYEPILTALEMQPMTIGELTAMPAFADAPTARVQQAVIILISKGAVDVCLPEDGEDVRKTRTDTLNLAVMMASRESNDISFLASPVTGSGIAVDRISQLIILAGREGKDPCDFIWGIFKKQGQRLIKDGTVLKSESENISEIQMRLTDFNEKLAGVLRSLKIN